MLSFLSELRKRNSLLSLFGWVCWLGAFCCTLLYQADPTIITGINAWIKPFKFFASLALLSWTMAWLLFYLDARKKVKIYSWVLVITMAIEITIVVWQAAHGRRSHFNFSSPLNGALFGIMGFAILLFTLWSGYMGYLFFRQKKFSISDTYVWGIRLGILFFVIFSFEGGLMVQRLAHTVGGVDGSPGLPLFNWSKEYGDLRVAHFFGMHSLQLLPLMGAWLTNTVKQLFIFAVLYFILLAVFLVQAFLAVPFIS